MEWLYWTSSWLTGNTAQSDSDNLSLVDEDSSSLSSNKSSGERSWRPDPLELRRAKELLVSEASIDNEMSCLGAQPAKGKRSETSLSESLLGKSLRGLKHHLDSSAILERDETSRTIKKFHPFELQLAKVLLTKTGIEHMPNPLLLSYPTLVEQAS